MDVYFSDYFGVTRETLEEYGAFDISLVTDLPLFIDPFLLFNSKKDEYQKLHASIVEYLRFLKQKSYENENIDSGLIKAWYAFSEVKQNWLGFSVAGNAGRGLGTVFANVLHENLNSIFSGFGSERVTSSSHLEKLCLVSDGVGKDSISDFATNLIKGFLAQYTQEYARRYIPQSKRKIFSVTHAQFSYSTQTWVTERFELPNFNGDYVLLTPKDLLTKDDTWINQSDLIENFEDIPSCIQNEQLRSQINNYFRALLPDQPKAADRRSAAKATIRKFPVVIDYYISKKEQHGDEARDLSESKVLQSYNLYVEKFGELSAALEHNTKFYSIGGNTYDEALARAHYLKDAIENKGCHKYFYVNGQPITSEVDLHIMYRLTWFGTPSDVSREVNDGRGPADFKISRGASDKTIVEFKLASNGQLKRNLKNQTPIYEKASDATRSIKVIVFFTQQEEAKVKAILNELGIAGKENVILIDARMDNKPSGSKA